MSFGFCLFIGILALGGVIAMLLSKYKDAKNYNSNGVPLGMEEQYQIALNPGSDGKPLMYDLTTCNHCVRVHEFFKKRGIAHHDITVDHFIGKARAEVVAKLRTYNPKASFPTVVFPDGKVIVGFKESALREALGIDSKENSDE